MIKKVRDKEDYWRRVKEHKNLYNLVFGKELNLDNPRDLNEKLHWLIINRFGEREGMLADKNYVKGYISNLHVKDLNIPKTIATYKNVDDIKLDELPSKFVLKCNHFSGNVFICKDKKHFDFDVAKKQLGVDLKKNFANINLEYHYSYIDPLIMAEEYLDDGVHKNPVDYKIYCFNGKAESILFCSDRERSVRFNDYDLDWNELDYSTLEFRSKHSFKKPKNLKKMLKIAEEISKDLPFVRVDLYEINNKIYFGEYTFTPGAGIICYYNQDALDYLGSRIDLDLFG